MPFFAGASLFLAVNSAIQQSKAARSQRKSNELQSRISDIKAQRERTRLISESRRKRATLVSQAELTGTTGSSGVIGGQQGLQSDFAGSVSFLDQVQQLGKESNIFTQRAANYSSSASVFSSLSGVSKSYSKMTGGLGDLLKPNDVNNPKG